MSRYSLAGYLLKLTNKKNNQVQQLDNIQEGDLSIHINDIFKNYFHLKMNQYTDYKEEKKAFLIQKYKYVEEQNNDLINYTKHIGILETGSYGYSSTIYDDVTHQVLYRKSPQNPEMLPFFYGFYVPEQSSECICIFQRFGNFGFKSIIENDLRNYFKDNCPDYKLTINPLLPSDYINNFINNGRILKLRLLSNSIPEDIADAIGKNKKAKSELVIKAAPKEGLCINNIISKIIHRKSSITQAFEVTDFEYDNAKIEVQIGKTKKTLDLGELENITGYLDITDDVHIIKGHPTFNSIELLSKEYAEHFLRERDIVHI